MDRGFVFAAISIGAAYVLIIVLLERFIGQTAAGVGGVALTALATGIFKQFETLRFKTTADERVVQLPKARPYEILTGITSLYGVQFITGLIGFPVVLWIIGKNDRTFSTNTADLLSRIGSDHRLLVATIILNCIAFACGGYLLGKAVPRISVATIAVCAWFTLIAVVAVLIIPLSSVIRQQPGLLGELLSALLSNVWLYVAWILYVALAAWGAYHARGRSFQIANKPGGELREIITPLPDA